MAESAGLSGQRRADALTRDGRQGGTGHGLQSGCLRTRDRRGRAFESAELERGTGLGLALDAAGQHSIGLRREAEQRQTVDLLAETARRIEVLCGQFVAPATQPDQTILLGI